MFIMQQSECCSKVELETVERREDPEIFGSTQHKQHRHKHESTKLARLNSQPLVRVLAANLLGIHRP